MRFDIVIVSYNSQRWLPACFAALAAAQYDLSRLTVTVVDNASAPPCRAQIAQLTAQYATTFGAVQHIQNEKNLGFGRACNRGAQAGGAPWLFFLNPDCEIDPGLFTALEAGIAAHPDAGGFECRQLPYGLGHHIDPVTLQTPWASGAALLVRRATFTALSGFDPHLFLYCEDIDLSWRITATGQPLYYLPRALVMHQVLQREDNTASELREYAGTLLGRLLLRYKYRGPGGIFAAHREYLSALKSPRHFPGVRRLLAKNYLRHFAKLWPFLFWRLGHRPLYKNAPACFAAGFAADRGRAVLPTPLAAGPKISVVVRTHARPAVLRGALQSLAHQTYSNYEVIVIEDGAPTSQPMVEQEFAHLPLRYHATGQNVGRGRAGNLGLEMATGDYLNFLDDDDFFYPDHLELMAATAAQHPKADLVLGCAMVMKVDVTSKDPYQYAVREILPMRFDRLDVFTMCQTCQIPIQSAIFKKSLFLQCGGLAEDMAGHEDWAMWLRFLTRATRINPRHIDIHRATSVFVLPASRTQAQERLEFYRGSDRALFDNPSLRFTVTLADMRYFYDGMIGDMQHLRTLSPHKMDEYLNYQANRDHIGPEPYFDAGKRKR